MIEVGVLSFSSRSALTSAPLARFILDSFRIDPTTPLVDVDEELDDEIAASFSMDNYDPDDPDSVARYKRAKKEYEERADRKRRADSPVKLTGGLVKRGQGKTPAPR